VNASPLLAEFADELRQASSMLPVLDLACGTGRNGLTLLKHGIPVVFADIRPEALAEIQETLQVDEWRECRHLASFWHCDFEQATGDPLAGQYFGAIMVFRYLHRPLFEPIKHSVTAGGLLIYETFTEDQPQFGRPTNPEFLLQHNELASQFEDWSVLHSFEGIKKTNGQSTAIAQLIARKPRV
jgi:tellurite methyltransferase